MESKIKTIEDAYKAMNRTPFVLPTIDGLSEIEIKYMKDNFDLSIVVEAINKESNEGNPWEPDYSNSKQSKYEPSFWIDADKKNPSGFEFSGTTCDDWGTATGVGSRFVFHSTEALYYTCEQFKELYLSVILKQK